MTPPPPFRGRLWTMRAAALLAWSEARDACRREADGGLALLCLLAGLALLWGFVSFITY